MIKQQGDEIAIKVENVSKSFKLPHEKSDSLKGRIVNFAKHNKGYEIQEALKGISFEVKKGEFFGIVGRNGSGKSTLLKLMSGIYTPDSGDIQVNGKLTPFIELGVGFNPDLSGRENVFLNGALLGFNRKEMEAMYDEIVAFAELERFMDQKLKNYSSGMQVRLAFSIAIQANTDVLVLDEVLAVGDEAFQRKCYSYFSKLKRDKKTVILVTHSMESVQQFCDRALMIEGGKIVVEGNPAIVAQNYTELFKPKPKDEAGKPLTRNPLNLKTSYDIDAHKLKFSIALSPKQSYDDPVVGVFMRRDNGEIIWRWSSDDKTNEELDVRLTKTKTTKLKFSLDNILPDGSFMLTVLIRKGDKSEEYVRYSDVIKFDNYTSDVYHKQWKMKEQVEVTYGK